MNLVGLIILRLTSKCTLYNSTNFPMYWLIHTYNEELNFVLWDFRYCKSKWTCLVPIDFDINDDSVIWFISGSILQTQIDLCWFELKVTCIVLKPVICQFLSPGNFGSGPSYHGACLQDMCGADIVMLMSWKKYTLKLFLPSWVSQAIEYIA